MSKEYPWCINSAKIGETCHKPSLEHRIAQLEAENARLNEELAYRDRIAAAHLTGISACLDGLKLEDNPYSDTGERNVWEIGYLGQAEIEKARQDGERLEWVGKWLLADDWERITANRFGITAAMAEYTPEFGEVTATTIREAIDAAIAQEETK